MKKQLFILIAIFAIFFTSCEKEGNTGSQGLTGPQGEQGLDGDDGNANVDFHQFFVNLASFSYYSQSKIYKANAPYTLPTIQDDDAVLVYMYNDPIDGLAQWVPTPFTHFFNSSNNYNYFTFSIGSDGKLDLFIRNSTGGAPYDNMYSGGLNYRMFIIESKQYQEMENYGIDTYNYKEVQSYLKKSSHKKH